MPRIVGPIHPPPRSRSATWSSCGAHRPAGEDDGARAVHDDPAGAERPLPGPRVGRDGVRRGGQRGDQGPARGRRRRRPDRRAVHAGPPGRRPRVRPGRAEPLRSTGVTGTTAVHLCFGYAAIIHERPPGYSFLPELAGCPVDQISIETAQSGLDLGVLADLSDKTIILGVLDLSTPEVETRRGRSPHGCGGPTRTGRREQLVIAPDCGMKYLPRASAEGKMRAMAGAAALLRAECRKAELSRGSRDAAGHRGQHHRAGRRALGHRERPAARARSCTALVRHLHDFAREVRLTEAEWMAAIEWLTRTGQISDEKREEFILASDVLGLSMLVVQMNHRLDPGATPATVLGPVPHRGLAGAGVRRRHVRRACPARRSTSPAPSATWTASRSAGRCSTCGRPTPTAPTRPSSTSTRPGCGRSTPPRATAPTACGRSRRSGTAIPMDGPVGELIGAHRHQPLPARARPLPAQRARLRAADHAPVPGGRRVPRQRRRVRHQGRAGGRLRAPGAGPDPGRRHVEVPWLLAVYDFVLQAQG